MRVAQIAPLWESVPPKLYGGTERVVHNLTRGLVAAGVDVTVFCSGGSDTEGSMEVVWPEALRMASRKISDPFAYQFRMLDAVARRAGEFDVIHNHYDYPMLELTRLTKVPVISTMHHRMDLPDLSIAMEGFRNAPLVSISAAQRRPLPNLNWVSTILHGIDVATYRFHPEPGKYLAFLGRISPEKRPDWAIDIALASGIPLKIAAKIDDADRQYYEANIKRRIDGRFIEYIGEINEAEKSSFLGGALALAFPVDWPEPFGLVMIEAMACGTPVLSRPCGSVPEVVCDGVTGFVRTDIRDLAATAAAASTLDRGIIRRHAVTKFSIERMTREYLNVYTQLSGENPKNRHKSAKPRPVAHNRWDLLYPLHGAADRDSKGFP